MCIKDDETVLKQEGQFTQLKYLSQPQTELVRPATNGRPRPFYYLINVRRAFFFRKSVMITETQSNYRNTFFSIYLFYFIRQSFINFYIISYLIIYPLQQC